MIRMTVVAVTAALAPFALACSTTLAAGESPQQRDYQRLSGKWQLTSAVIDGKPVPASQVRHTILMTQGNRFWLPQSSAAGTHTSGTFTINPATIPKQVDSRGAASNGKTVLVRGIYEIIDADHQRECFGPPGGARPASFASPPGSRRILQYWKKIGPAAKM